MLEAGYVLTASGDAVAAGAGAATGATRAVVGAADVAGAITAGGTGGGGYTAAAGAADSRPDAHGGPRRPGHCVRWLWRFARPLRGGGCPRREVVHWPQCCGC